MTVPTPKRINSLASIGLSVALLGSVTSCAVERNTGPKPPTLIIQGQWDYAAMQPVGSGGAFEGTLDITTVDGDNFSGGFDGQTVDTAGAAVHITAVVNGQRTDSTSVRFLFSTPRGDTLENTGTQTGDTLTGQWTNRRAIQIGSFAMVREGTDKLPGELTKSVRPRRP
jgi:hypothetical protein